MATALAYSAEKVYSYVTGAAARRDDNAYLQDNFAPVHDEVFDQVHGTPV